MPGVNSNDLTHGVLQRFTAKRLQQEWLDNKYWQQFARGSCVKSCTSCNATMARLRKRAQRLNGITYL